MRVELQQVPKLVFGANALTAATEFLSRYARPLVITSPSNRTTAEKLSRFVDDSTQSEPTVEHFQAVLERARDLRPDVVVGLGGGSPLDAAKLVAALCNSSQTLQQALGIGNLAGRSLPLVCIPTTAGTGSEVSPNAILLDEADSTKKAVISPFLVPDATFIDPSLMLTVPPAVTAATGLDALTHCIEAYANNFSNRLVDTWALDGIRLIAGSLTRAVQQPDNLEARTNVALGSLYGGLCLGPVNTAAVHALSYALGGRFHIPHGHANAILLPHVMRFNLEAAPARYATIALALGAEPEGNDSATAMAGIRALWRLIESTGLEMRLGALRIPESEIPAMAAAGLAVIRLMKNNPRPMTQQNAEQIYAAVFAGHQQA